MSITARWHPPPIGIPAKIWAPTLVASPPKWHHRQKWTSPSSMKSTHEPCLNRLIRPTWRIPPMRIPSPSQQGLTLRHRNILSFDRTAGATINGYHHPLASPPERMSITARGITAKEKRTKNWASQLVKKKGNLFIKKIDRYTQGKRKKIATIKRIVRWVKCKWGKRSKCMQEQIQQSNAIQHCSGQCTERK